MPSPLPHESDWPPDYDELPVRPVTMNQLVAYNISYWRRALSMTQEELGRKLGDLLGALWSKATVSAAERSWEGRRVRQFSADELLALSQALEVPMPGLFLPPTDDGVDTRYVVAHHGIYQGMGDFLERFFPTGDTSRPVEEGYLERVHAAFDFYFGGDAGDAPGAGRQTQAPDTEDQLWRLRQQSDVVRGLLGDMERSMRRLEAQIDPPETEEETSSEQKLREARQRLKHAVAVATKARDDAAQAERSTYTGSMYQSLKDSESRQELMDKASAARRRANAAEQELWEAEADLRREENRQLGKDFEFESLMKYPEVDRIDEGNDQ